MSLSRVRFMLNNYAEQRKSELVVSHSDRDEDRIQDVGPTLISSKLGRVPPRMRLVLTVKRLRPDNLSRSLKLLHFQVSQDLTFSFQAILPNFVTLSQLAMHRITSTNNSLRITAIEKRQFRGFH